MSEDYDDGILRCDASGLHIRGYYFPWGTKDIAYGAMKGLRRFEMSALRGKGRVWGTANFKYWANLDVGRPKKRVGMILNTGKAVQPFLTPEHPDAFEALIRERARLGPDLDVDGTAPFV